MNADVVWCSHFHKRWLTYIFYRLSQFKTSEVLSSVIFILGKVRLDVAIRNDATKDFEKMFFEYFTKNVALSIFLVWGSQFCAKETAHGHKKNIVSGVV